YLLGEMTLDRLYLRPLSYYNDQNITLHLGKTVDQIDRAKKQVLFDGESLEYDDLVLALGSQPRRLPEKIGGSLGKVFTVRDLTDVDALAPEFTRDKRVLIIGGGYIGLEAAAVAAQRGLKVTLVEMADRILQRVAAPQTSDYFHHLHTAHGVEIKEGVRLARLTEHEGTVTGAELSDGTLIEIDFAIVGVGIFPVTDIASDAGLSISDGITVNAFGQTSDPSIWAAGDCCAFPYRGGELRLESVPHAIDQAELVAQNIMGASLSYVPKPWFWSDQYDVKLQITGLNTGFDNVITRSTSETSISFWYYKAGHLIAVDAMNDPRAYMVAKRLIEAGKTADQAVVADPNIDLKGLLKT
ncbi:MAG: FAD-dependent oxidoreductase, partial [Paracoccaceae bacterium]